MTRGLRHYLRDERGLSAAEFTMVLPVLLLFVFGFMHLCLMMYTVTRLHWSAQDAARCASIRTECKTAGVTSSALVEAWALDHYGGFTQPDYQYSFEACGHKVTGTANYAVTLPFYSHTFALNSAACFP